MKYQKIKKLIFENKKNNHFLSSREKIEVWLNHYRIKNYQIIAEGTSFVIDVNGHVILHNKNLRSLPYKFRNVTGDFHVGGNQLTSFENFPDKIGKSLIVSYNQISSLEGIPFVKEDILMSHNKLSSLILNLDDFNHKLDFSFNEIKEVSISINYDIWLKKKELRENFFNYTTLDLSHNNIENIDLKKIKIQKLQLMYNKIKKIKFFPGIDYIIAKNNLIYDIKGDISHIRELDLTNNCLKNIGFLNKKYFNREEVNNQNKYNTNFNYQGFNFSNNQINSLTEISADSNFYLIFQDNPIIDIIGQNNERINTYSSYLLAYEKFLPIKEKNMINKELNNPKNTMNLTSKKTTFKI